MTRQERFKLLKLFADKIPHDWFNIVFLGVNYLRIEQSYFEKIFKLGLEYNLIRRVDTSETLRVKQESNYVLSWKQYEYVLTDRGDACLRDELIRREDTDYNRNFNRSVDGKYGLDRYAPLPNGLQKF